ncbi:MAG: TIGR02281 family clan AA aspartic protease, partial [Brevundimonas sp.]
SADAAPAGAAPVYKAADGHFWAQARIDGRAVKVLVDTGASVVALTPEDAARLGLDPAPEEFRHAVQTANGQTLAAAVTLDEVRIGSARVEDVEALIVRDGLPYSLLGMSYLGRLSAFEARSGSLILRP